MSTTEAVAEIFFAGLLASLWLGVAFVSLITPEQLKMLVAFFSSTAGLIILGAISYQLGWIVNSVTFALATHTYCSRLIRSAFGGNIDRPLYYRVKLAIYADSRHEYLINELERETAIDRVARAGGLNFFMLAAMLLIFKPTLLPASVIIVLLVLSALSWRLSYRRKGRYYKLVAQAGEQLFPVGFGRIEKKTTDEGEPLPSTVSATHA